MSAAAVTTSILRPVRLRLFNGRDGGLWKIGLLQDGHNLTRVTVDGHVANNLTYDKGEELTVDFDGQEYTYVVCRVVNVRKDGRRKTIVEMRPKGVI